MHNYKYLFSVIHSPSLSFLKRHFALGRKCIEAGMLYQITHSHQMFYIIFPLFPIPRFRELQRQLRAAETTNYRSFLIAKAICLAHCLVCLPCYYLCMDFFSKEKAVLALGTNLQLFSSSLTLKFMKFYSIYSMFKSHASRQYWPQSSKHQAASQNSQITIHRAKGLCPCTSTKQRVIINSS